MNRVALYARVSTKDKGQDTENQLVQLRAFAAAQNWTVTREYIDHVSASGLKKRPEFDAMFEDAARRRFDCVLFWSLDRFSREGVSDTLRHLEKLTSWKVSWRSYQEQFLDSSGVFKDAVLAILAVIARQERERIRERTLAGLDRARAKGVRLGAKPRVYDRQKAWDMHLKGVSVRKVAAASGVSTSVIMRLLKERKAQGGS